MGLGYRGTSSSAQAEGERARIVALARISRLGDDCGDARLHTTTPIAPRCVIVSAFQCGGELRQMRAAAEHAAQRAPL